MPLPDEKMTEAVKFMAPPKLLEEIQEKIEESDFPRMTRSEWVRQACEEKLERSD